MDSPFTSIFSSAVRGVGLIFLFASFYILSSNEHSTIDKKKAMQEGQHAVTTISADKIDPSNDGKLVYVTGSAITQPILTDPIFGITQQQTIKLRRVVKIYQWQEVKVKHDYTYKQVWLENLIRSSSFKYPEGHTNPIEKNYSSDEWLAEHVQVGAFKSALTKEQLFKFTTFTPVDITNFKLPEIISTKFKFYNNAYYISANPQNPNIGDVQISFEFVPASVVTIVAKQIDDTLVPYSMHGRDISLIEAGNIPIDQMFGTELTNTTILTWVLRVVGFLCMFGGLSLILKPSNVAVGLMPGYGTIILAIFNSYAILISLVLSALVIVISWSPYHAYINWTLLIILSFAPYI